MFATAFTVDLPLSDQQAFGQKQLALLPLGKVAKTDSTSDDVTLLLLLEYMGIRKVGTRTLGRMICGLLPRKLGID